jgi:uncharacterized peroxidase-related enzyme
MRVDGNHGGTIAYEPNTKGEWQEQPDYAEPPLALHGPADRWDYRADDNDYFTQPGDLFRLMTPDKQQLLFENTARNIAGVSQHIVDKHIAHCTRPTRPTAQAWRAPSKRSAPVTSKTPLRGPAQQPPQPRFFHGAGAFSWLCWSPDIRKETTPMSRRYPFPDLNTLPEDIRARILEVQEKAGFIPNVFLAFARRPAEWRAFFAYHDALMLKEEGSLTKGEREMIVTTTSAANQCLYCVVAHGAILRIYEKKPFVADQVAVNHRKADITPRQRAMLDFAMKVCQRAHEMEDADFAALHAHGLDDEDIWDIAAITAFFGLSNRMASFAGMQPNPEFYLMGRTPKQKKQIE